MDNGQYADEPGPGETGAVRTRSCGRAARSSRAGPGGPQRRRRPGGPFDSRPDHVRDDLARTDTGWYRSDAAPGTRTRPARRPDTAARPAPGPLQQLPWDDDPGNGSQQAGTGPGYGREAGTATGYGAQGDTATEPQGLTGGRPGATGADTTEPPQPTPRSAALR